MGNEYLRFIDTLGDGRQHITTWAPPGPVDFYPDEDGVIHTTADGFPPHNNTYKPTDEGLGWAHLLIESLQGELIPWDLTTGPMRRAVAILNKHGRFCIEIGVPGYNANQDEVVDMAAFTRGFDCYL